MEKIINSASTREPRLAWLRLFGRWQELYLATIVPDACKHTYFRPKPKVENKPEIVTYLWHKSVRPTPRAEHQFAQRMVHRLLQRVLHYRNLRSKLIPWDRTGTIRKQLTAIWRTSESINRTFIVLTRPHFAGWIMCCAELGVYGCLMKCFYCNKWPTECCALF